MEKKDTKSKILELINNKPGISTMEMAKELGMSLSNILQHLKNLKKDYPIVSVPAKPAGRGKPKKGYYFKHIFEGLGHIRLSGVSKNHGLIEKELEIDDYLELHLNTLQIPQKEYRYYVAKFYWKIEKFLDKIDVIAIFGSVAKGTAREDSDVDCLIITDSKKELEDKIGSLIIKKMNKEPKIFLCQFFSKKEFKTNLKKKSKFAEEILKNHVVLYDKEGFLRGLKKIILAGP